MKQASLVLTQISTLTRVIKTNKSPQSLVIFEIIKRCVKTELFVDLTVFLKSQIYSIPKLSPNKNLIF